MFEKDRLKSHLRAKKKSGKGKSQKIIISLSLFSINEIAEKTVIRINFHFALVEGNFTPMFAKACDREKSKFLESFESLVKKIKSRRLNT
jgi:hypothetical protein